ncbi:MAG: prenyltransferase [Bacteroidetes bacterium]|nr:prenyltransferase [Bacteroidota bacterium]
MSATDRDALRVAKQVFRENKAFTLVTQGSSGVWAGKAYFAEHDGYLYTALEQGRNYRNLLENPEVTFVIERGVPDRFVQGKGIAEPLGPIEDRPERHYIFRKALELVLYAKLIPGVTVFRIRPTKLFVSDFTKFWKPRAEVEVTEDVLELFRTELKDRHSSWRLYWKAVRPFSFTVTLAPVLLGAMLAPQLSWPLLGLTLLGALLAHAGINVLSDYMDWRRGADTWRVLGSSRVLVDKLMRPQLHRAFGALLLVLAALIGAWLALRSGPAVGYLALAGAALGVFYTAPPVGLKYRALGDIAVFLAFGPLMALGSYYVQTGALASDPVWLSVPLGLLTIAVLHGNNYRDILEDRSAGYRTLAGLLGPRGSAWYYVALLAGAYALSTAFVAAGWLPVWALAVWATLPVAARNIQVAFNHARVAFSFLDLLSAQLHLYFSAALIGGLFLDRLLS